MTEVYEFVVAATDDPHWPGAHVMLESADKGLSVVFRPADLPSGGADARYLGATVTVTITKEGE